jgi:hypothetical protein
MPSENIPGSALLHDGPAGRFLHVVDGIGLEEVREIVKDEQVRLFPGRPDFLQEVVRQRMVRGVFADGEELVVEQLLQEALEIGGGLVRAGR